MPTGYVRKLAKKHGVSTSTAEKHWSMAKAAAKKEGHDEDYGYVTSIFKNMMHEKCFIPTLKDLTQGLTFKYFLIAEADEAIEATKERSPAYQHLADRFPQFMELPFKARKELEKEATEPLAGYETLDQEEKDSVDDYLHDMVIDKMQAVHGTGRNIGDWKGEEEYKKREQYRRDLEAALDAEEGQPKPQGGEDEDDLPSLEPEPKKQRFSAGPRHIAAMRQQHIPVDRAAEAPAGSDEIGTSYKYKWKPMSQRSPEQRANASKQWKKHGTIYRVKNATWFRALAPEQQQVIMDTIKAGGSVADGRAKAGI